MGHDDLQSVLLRRIQDDFVMLWRRIGNGDDVDAMRGDVGEIFVINRRGLRRILRQHIVAHVADAAFVPQAQWKEGRFFSEGGREATGDQYDAEGELLHGMATFRFCRSISTRFPSSSSTEMR